MSNSLVGSIPTQITALTLLQSISLGLNTFNGSMPALQAPRLTYFTVAYSTLSGPFPSWLFDCTGIQWIDLYRNKFAGPIPDRIGTLTTLTYLGLEKNAFNGTVPPVLGSLTRLKKLAFGTNNFQGALPSSLGHLSSLTYLAVHQNSFSGQIPDMPFWPNLTSFRANDNLFTGTLPFLGVSPRKFLNLDLFNNPRISGTIPSYLSGLYGLTRLDLSNLTLHGPFPASLLKSDNKFKSLQYLSLHSNALTGSLFGDLPPQPVLPKLRYLYMQNNDLSGTLPLNFGYAYPQLEGVLLGGNRLSSTIPPSLFDISNLLAVDLSHNSLSGSIALNGTAGNIINLYLSWNSLTGSIPPSICPSLPEIETIDVSHNLLSGSPPFCLAKAFKKLHSLSLAANRLTSSSLDFLPQTGNVNLVDISSNSFQGVLPSAFFSVNANKLQTFAAASNCLQGSIPPSLCLASRLQTLVLDGLNGGRACRVLVATSDGNSNAFKFTGTKTRTQMQGELPSCLFTLLPNISTLHVSGNGLSGNIFSSLARWPASLKDLSASHNRLSGTIPAHLQQTMGQFRVFDLANNKLRGLLDQVANLSSADAQISLKVNRFSGQLSSAIISAPAPIAVLEGNLFGCTSHSQLPDGDAFKPRFECGSDSFNGVLIAFVVVLLTAAVSVFSAHKLHHLLLPAMPAHIALAKMLSSLWALRLFLLVATAVFALVLLPVYGAVSATHGTHTFSYAWTVSAVFIGGEAAAGVFLFFWLPLLVAAYYWLISQQQEHRKNSSKEEKEKLKTSLSSTFLSFDGKVHDRRLTLLASRLLTFAVNVAFVLPPNIGGGADAERQDQDGD